MGNSKSAIGAIGDSMMEDDKDLLDLFAFGAMLSKQVPSCPTDAEYAQRCWRLALAMKMERDQVIDNIEAQSC